MSAVRDSTWGSKGQDRPVGQGCAENLAHEGGSAVESRMGSPGRRSGRARGAGERFEQDMAVVAMRVERDESGGPDMACGQGSVGKAQRPGADRGDICPLAWIMRAIQAG